MWQISFCLFCIIGVFLTFARCEYLKECKHYLESKLSNPVFQVLIDSVKVESFRRISLSDVRCYHEALGSYGLGDISVQINLSNLLSGGKILLHATVNPDNKPFSTFSKAAGVLNVLDEFSVFTGKHNINCYFNEGDKVAHFIYGKVCSGFIDYADPEGFSVKCQIEITKEKQSGDTIIASTGDFSGNIPLMWLLERVGCANAAVKGTLCKLKWDVHDSISSSIAIRKKKVNTTHTQLSGKRMINVVLDDCVLYDSDIGKISLSLSSRKNECDVSAVLMSIAPDQVCNYSFRRTENAWEGGGLIDAKYMDLVMRFCRLKGLLPQWVVNVKPSGELKWQVLFGGECRNIASLSIPFSIDTTKYGYDSVLCPSSYVADITVFGKSANTNIISEDKTLQLRCKHSFTDNSHTHDGNIVLSKMVKIGDFVIHPGECDVSTKVSTKANKESAFSVKVNMNNIALDVHQFGLHIMKDQRVSANFDGLYFSQLCHLDILCNGDNGLLIEGNYTYLNGKSDLILSKVRYSNSDYSCRIISGKDYVETKISGDALDLSQSDLKVWISPTYTTYRKELDICLDQIFMKGDRTLQQVQLNSVYESGMYSKGEFDCRLIDNFVHVILRDADIHDKTEVWRFQSDNSGDVMKALGIYDDVDKGVLYIDYLVDRSTVTAKTPFPIINGDLFVFDFRAYKLPFFLKMTCASNVLRPFVKRSYNVFNFLKSDFSISSDGIYISKLDAKGFISHWKLYNCTITDKSARGQILVAPSWYGVGNVIRSVPVIGKVIDYVGLPGVWIPYSLKLDY
ncbi:hypothetical protein [Candidatus Sneabacter namystus]|uniref:Uncharacterized protein n=1 Tax=Candidatus Sneabacter namystus TaxID=2601646 RepID=A0A5C0UIL9_9RICK|nr:hypothetical protein [Candidatus Sneabacter namystus]QEK39461.1 hypothetical protein FZC37_00710 [Candidatus Sneabacter namystus]